MLVLRRFGCRWVRERLTLQYGQVVVNLGEVTLWLSMVVSPTLGQGCMCQRNTPRGV
jgi:hypothetical protein